MLLVLTYHRIVENPAAISDFFDVTATELERHLQIVKVTWRRCAMPADVLAAQGQRDDTRSGFLVTLDDGTTDHFTAAAPMLERHGMRGVFFVNTGRLGKAGYLTLSQCQELQARGHAVESHSREHKRLTDLPPGVLHRHLAESRRVLKDAGLGHWDFLAPPGGAFDSGILQAAKAEGYALLRTLEWGYNRLRTGLPVESITINRSTAGRWFGFMASPRLEWAKKAFYHSKESVKRSSFSSLYFGMRELNPKRKTMPEVSRDTSASNAPLVTRPSKVLESES